MWGSKNGLNDGGSATVALNKKRGTEQNSPKFLTPRAQKTESLNRGSSGTSKIAAITSMDTRFESGA